MRASSSTSPPREPPSRRIVISAHLDDVVRHAVLAARPDATLYADLPYALKSEHAGFELPAPLRFGAER